MSNIVDTSDKSLQAKVFNLGCDARLQGKSPIENPYKSGRLNMMWALGWLDVDRFWGCKAKHPITKLTRVHHALE